jgi:hypothetical protein
VSWDIHIQDLPDVASVGDIPDDFEPRILGKRCDVIDRIAEIVPAADFSDPAWGRIDGDGWSIEINIGEADDCDCLMLHVRGGGDDVVDVVAAILKRLAVRGVDLLTGEFFEAEAARKSFEEWCVYRDQVAANSQPES